MMKISVSLPAKSINPFQTRRASFKCRSSTLNPTLLPHKLAAGDSNDHDGLTRKHIANLEKLLQKTTEPDPRRAVIDDSESKTKGRGLLDLARIWPEMKAAEEVSPRHLNRLQRLLSMTAEYSPRSSLASRWREYHGCNDWVGLLDPLDENLRREVIRYGEFVQAAYHAFHSNPAMSADEAPQPRHVALPDRSYKVTRSLYATASVGLPKWVDDVAPDLGWMTQRSSWIGYVAVCDDKKEIQRMGRRDIVISLRGTSTCLEWAENMRAQLVPMSESDPAQKVECGFLSLHKTHGAHVTSLAESVVEEIKNLMETYKGETLSITITGHSLGAALALLAADELSSCIPDAPPIAVFSFGGPRVGNRGFVNRLESKNVKVLRIVNNQDVITRVPAGPVFEANDGYSHAGTELRVDTKMSPYLKPNADVACCHDLEAYLHLVDGFLSSNCPFRANAKRSLVKLLSDQRSNVKKLYISKANALSLNLERGGAMDHRAVYPSCLPSPS